MVRLLAGARSLSFSRTFGFHLWAQCVSCLLGSFLGVKRPGRGVDNPLPSSAEINNNMRATFKIPFQPKIMQGATRSCTRMTTTKTLPSLDKAKPNAADTRGLIWVKVKVVTLQLPKLRLFEMLKY